MGEQGQCRVPVASGRKHRSIGYPDIFYALEPSPGVAGMVIAAHAAGSSLMEQLRASRRFLKRMKFAAGLIGDRLRDRETRRIHILDHPGILRRRRCMKNRHLSSQVIGALLGKRHPTTVMARRFTKSVDESDA